MQTILRTEQLETKTVYEDLKGPDGFTDRVAALSFVSGTRTFTITGDHEIYINGLKYNNTTGSIVIANTVGTHWVYYNASNIISESLSEPAFYLPFIATVYWDGTKGVVGEERHGTNLPWTVHQYLHTTVGCRYVSGLAGTFTDTTISIDAGTFVDEDIQHTFALALTTCNVFYKNGSADFTWDGAQSVPYKTNAGVIRYNNGNALADVPAANHVAYWVFATNDIDTPIMVLMGQRVDVTLANARINNTYESLVFARLPYRECKVLYRTIFKNVAGTPTYIEAEDLRAVNNTASGAYVATSHNLLSDLQLVGSGVMFGHVSDQAETIYGDKNIDGDTTFSGESLFKNSLTTSLPTQDINLNQLTGSFIIRQKNASALVTADQSFYTGVFSAATDADPWQSITCGLSGFLRSVLVNNFSGITATGCTLKIFLGTGVSGTLLAEVACPNLPHDTDVNVAPTYPIYIASGTVFTAQVYGGSNFQWKINVAGGYAGGSFMGGAADAYFYTYMYIDTSLVFADNLVSLDAPASEEVGFQLKSAGTLKWKYSRPAASANFVLNDGTINAETWYTGGSNVKPYQPYFNVYRNGDVVNAIGGSAWNTISFNAERIDNRNCFNTGTYQFTAPVTGKYHLAFCVNMDAIGGGHTYGLTTLRTSNKFYRFTLENTYQMNSNPDASVAQSGATVADMDAGDTAFVTSYNIGTKTITLMGGADEETWFAGGLLY